MPYNIAKQVLPILNAGPIQKKRDLESRDFNFEPLTEVCPEGIVSVDHDYLKPHFGPMTRGLHRRQTTNRTPGYVTEGNSPFQLFHAFISPLGYVHRTPR